MRQQLQDIYTDVRRICGTEGSVTPEFICVLATTARRKLIQPTVGWFFVSAQLARRHPGQGKKVPAELSNGHLACEATDLSCWPAAGCSARHRLLVWGDSAAGTAAASSCKQSSVPCQLDVRLHCQSAITNWIPEQKARCAVATINTVIA